MPLIPIRNQIISMTPIDESLTSCGQIDPCAVFQKGDPLMVQMKQGPCSDDLVCNGGFELQNDIITNGDFATNLSGWTASGFAWAAGVAATTTDGDMTQTGLIIVNAQTYSISYTVTDNDGTTDTLEFVLGGGLSAFGETTEGAHTITIVAGGADSDFIFLYTKGDSTGFSIDNVSVQGVICWEAEAGWIFSGESACHQTGFTNVLRENIYSSLSSGAYVSVSYSIFNMSAGTLEVKVGGTTSRTVTENGSYTDYIVSAMSDDYLTFTPSTDFDGCVVVEESYKLLNSTELSSIAGLYDDDDNLISAITPAINDEFVTAGFASGSLSEGCYKIKIIDPCAVNQNPELISNNRFIGNPSGWTWRPLESDSPQTIIAENGHIVYTSDGSGIGGNIQTMQSPQGIDYGWSGNACYNEYVMVTGEVGASFADVSVQVLLDGFGTGFDGFTGPFVSNHIYRVFVSAITDPVDGISKIRIDGGTSTAGETFEILEISAKHYGLCDERPNNIVPFESQCLLVKDEVTNSLVVKGYPEDTTKNRMLGFYFWSGFPFLFVRLLGHFANPRNPRKTNSYLYSSGRKRSTYVQLDKTWDFKTEDEVNADQNGMDTYAAALSCDRVYIENSISTSSNSPQYIWEEKELAPAWENGKLTAECVVEISRIDKTVFN